MNQYAAQPQEVAAFRGSQAPRFYKVCHLEITRSIISIVPVTKFAWEVPVLEFQYGPNNVKVVREYWIEKNFVEGAPTPESEYQRMMGQYGADEHGTPYVVMAYGQMFDIGRTLAEFMRSCVNYERPVDPQPNAAAAPEPPQVNIHRELMDLKARAEELGDPLLMNHARSLFQKAGLDWVERTDAPDPLAKVEADAEEPGDGEVDFDPNSVELPASIDPNGDGHIKATDALAALTALGVDPDPSAKQPELVEQLDEIIKAELVERGHPAELEGEKVVARYARARPLLLGK